MNDNAPDGCRLERDISPSDRAMVFQYRREIQIAEEQMRATTDTMKRLGLAQHIAELQTRRLYYLRRTM